MPEEKKKRKTTAPKQLINHLPPQAVDMERAVLGSLMVDRSGYDLVTDILKPDSFYDNKHQFIYDAISELSAEDKPFDALSVKAKLEEKGNFDKAGGMVYLADLMREATGSAGIRYHAQVIAEKYIKRLLISVTSQLQTDAFDETIDSNELLQQAQADLYSITQSKEIKDYTQIGPVVDTVYQRIHDASLHRGQLRGVPTLFHRLDAVTGGWQNSDLIIIAARPAMGKTALALSMARNIAVDQHIPLAFFSLEMSNEQLVNRLVSNVCELQATKLRDGDLQDYEWAQLDAKIDVLKDAPLYVDDTSSLSIFELRTKARRLVAEHGVKIIMIDYLQLMTASGMKFGNRQEEVSNISRSLKGLAKELNIPIIALSQLNRSVEKREGGDEAKRPQLSDLRESGAIEQDADIVCFIHRPEYYKIYASPDNSVDYRGKAEFIIAKHRNGEVKTVMLRFRPEYTRFMNLDDETFSGGSIKGGSMKGKGDSSNGNGSGFGGHPAPSGEIPPEMGGGMMPASHSDGYGSASNPDDPLGAPPIGEELPY